jgi:cell division protein ZapB
MDSFDTLEERVERLVARKKSLEEENAALKAQLAQLGQDKEAVATRIDGLLRKLQEELDA